MTAVHAGRETSVVVTADKEKGIITGSADIAAPPERVFRALSTDEQAKWWGQGPYRTHDYSIDLRPGGKWSCKATNPKGETSTVGGEYITVDPPRVLEYTWVPSWDNFQESRVRFEIEPTSFGSRVKLLHTGFEGREEMMTNHVNGWTLVLGWLAGYVTNN